MHLTIITVIFLTVENFIKKDLRTRFDLAIENHINELLIDQILLFALFPDRSFSSSSDQINSVRFGDKIISCQLNLNFSIFAILSLFYFIPIEIHYWLYGQQIPKPFCL